MDLSVKDGKKFIKRGLQLGYRAMPEMVQRGIKRSALAVASTGGRSKIRRNLIRQIRKMALAQQDLDFFLKLLDREPIEQLGVAHSCANVRGCIDLPHLEPWQQYIDEVYGHIPHYSPEYLRRLAFGGTCFRNHTCYMADSETPYVNVINGLRRTTAQPDRTDRSVYLFGASRVFGICNEDAHTFASYLQARYNAAGSARIGVWNYGCVAQTLESMLLQVTHAGIKAGDEVVVFARSGLEPDSGSGNFRSALAIHEFCRGRDVNFRVVFLPTSAHVFRASARERVFAMHQCYWLGQPMSRDFIISATGNSRIDPSAFGGLFYQGPSPRNIWRDPKTAASYDLYALGEKPEVLREDADRAVKLLHEYGVNAHNMLDIFDRPHPLGEVFVDPNHWGPKGNERIAGELYALLEEGKRAPAPITRVPADIVKDTTARAVVSLGKIARTAYADKPDIIDWLKEVENPAFAGRKEIGAIVMNCNPFTNGHRHLITYAASRMDAVYLFVVQEDRSFFPFTDRIMLVREGTRELADKVHVVPSGEFIISSFSFADYFTKEAAIRPADSTTDVLIFGAIIAPGLGITRRFVGEEPNCTVTNGYNQTMQALLPGLGIMVQIIPRLEQETMPISASSVRKALEEKDFETIGRLVPPATYRYLIERYQ